MVNHWKTYQPVPTPGPEVTQKTGALNFAERLAIVIWNSSGRKVMTISTTMTVMLASIGGIAAILEYATLPGWMFTLISIANLIGVIGVALLSWRMFGWKYRSKRSQGDERV